MALSAAPLSSPHGPRLRRVDRVMAEVCVALLPGALMMIWVSGWGVLINMALAVGFALAAEALVMGLRGRALRPALGDLSAVLTALLFALAVPPTLPWWMTLLGILFAILIAKQLYGGLGYNPFNPAMAGYLFLLVSYPVAMTAWPMPQGLLGEGLGLGDTARLILTGALPTGLSWDALAGATPLDQTRTLLAQGQSLSAGAPPVPGAAALAFLAGGLYLLARRVITWHIPVSMLGGLTLLATLFWLVDPGRYPDPLFHLGAGAAMLGAFFIATDPVTAATTRRGQLLYGFAIGLLVYLIRTFGGYPDGVAFAVLLMNIAAPTIDLYTQPRVYGHRR